MGVYHLFVIDTHALNVKVEVAVTSLPLLSETVLVTFTTHGYSNVLLLSLTDFLAFDYYRNIIYPFVVEF